MEMAASIPENQAMAAGRPPQEEILVRTPRQGMHAYPALSRARSSALSQSNLGQMYALAAFGLERPARGLDRQARQWAIQRGSRNCARPPGYPGNRASNIRREIGS